MKVRETEDGYVVEFFPQAKIVETKEEPERGWKVEIGYLENEDVFVPARVFYDKRFTLEEVLRYARRLEECKICNSLNMNVTNVEEIVADDKLKDYVRKAKEMRMRAAAVKGNGEKKEEEGRKLTEKLGKIALTRFYSPAELLLMGYLADDDELIEIAMNSVRDVDDLFKSPKSSENKNKKKKKKRHGRGAEIFRTVLLMNGGEGNGLA